MAPRPPPTLISFPKSTDQNFEIAILFSVVEKHNNYVFGANLLPHSPQGRGCKLQTLTKRLHIVMIIWKCTDLFGMIFWLEGGVEGRGYVGGSSLGGIFRGRSEIP